MITEIQGSISLCSATTPGNYRFLVNPFSGFMTPANLDIAASGAWSNHNLTEYYDIPEDFSGSSSVGITVSFSKRIAYTPDNVLVVGFSMSNLYSAATQTRLSATLYGWRWTSDFIHYDPNTG